MKNPFHQAVHYFLFGLLASVPIVGFVLLFPVRKGDTSPMDKLAVRWGLEAFL